MKYCYRVSMTINNKEDVQDFIVDKEFYFDKDDKFVYVFDRNDRVVSMFKLENFNYILDLGKSNEIK